VLQSLDVQRQADAVSPKHLQQMPALAAEHEQIAAGRVELLLPIIQISFGATISGRQLIVC
jgi:hypothetical protein